MEELQFNSVETIPVLNASAAFKTDSGKVFKEDVDIVPTIIDKSLSYIPWGGDNNMPYHIIDLIESDETLATCQMFNAEVCYGSGLQYNTDSCGGDVKREVEDFLLDNALPSYFLGVCQDFKHFAFCVSVVILNAEGTRIVRLIRKEACYCKSTCRSYWLCDSGWARGPGVFSRISRRRRGSGIPFHRLFP